MSRLLRRSALAAAAAAGVVAASEILVRIVDPYGVSHFVNMRDYSDLLVTHRPDSKRLFAHQANTAYSAFVLLDFYVVINNKTVL